MKMRKILITIMILSSLLAAESLSFEQIVNIALENNLSIKISENGLKISKNNVNPGNAGLLPNLSLIGSSNFRKNNPDVLPENELHSNSMAIQTSYTLFNGFYNLNSYKKLKFQYSQSELETRYQVENIIFSLAQAYYSLANTEEQLFLSRESKVISEVRLLRIQEKSKVGQANKVEVLAAEVDLNRDSIAVVNGLHNFNNSKRNLNYLLNRDINTDIKVNIDINLLTLPGLQELLNQALTKNADYLASKLGVNLAELDIKLAKSSYMPQLNLTGSYGLNKTVFDFDPNLSNPDKSWNVGISLNFNIFNGFKRKIQNQNAKIGLDNKKIIVEQTKLNLEKEVISNYSAYINSKRTLELEKQNLNSAQANFDRTREMYEMGRVTSVQFREAQLNLMRAKSNISLGLYSVKLNEINILKISGMLLN